MASAYTILLVEGRKPAADRLAPVLEREYELTTARTRRGALAKIEEAEPAVVVLDSPSLRFSQWRFCDTLQNSDCGIPVLLLWDEQDEIDHSVGARAHLQYPFSAQKLMNRISWLLPAPDSEVLQVADLILNLKRRSVVRGNRESHLTPKQAHLLELFMRHPGDVLTREFLMKRVWETDFTDDTRTLNVHIHWVRKAIEEDTGSPNYLHTVRGVGYRFDVPEETT